MSPVRVVRVRNSRFVAGGSVFTTIAAHCDMECDSCQKTIRKGVIFAIRTEGGGHIYKLCKKCGIPAIERCLNNIREQLEKLRLNK